MKEYMDKMGDPEVETQLEILDFEMHIGIILHNIRSIQTILLNSKNIPDEDKRVAADELNGINKLAKKVLLSKLDLLNGKKTSSL